MSRLKYRHLSPFTLPYILVHKLWIIDWWCCKDASQKMVSLSVTSSLCDLGHVTYSSYGIICTKQRTVHEMWRGSGSETVQMHSATCPSLRRGKQRPKAESFPLHSAFHMDLFWFLSPKRSNPILHYIRNVAVLFCVRVHEKNRGITTGECVSLLQGNSLSGYTWAVSRLQADYLYSHTVCLQRGSEAGLDPRTAQRVPSGAAHPSCGFYTVYSVFCFDSKMPAASALVTHRLERHHFKSDYPDITSVLRHLHLYKLNFNFCWLAWEVIFTSKLWKPCLFLLGFWICRPKYTFGDHIWKLGPRRSHFPIKRKEFREKHKLPSDFHGLWSSHTWWWSDRSDFKTYILRILHKYTWYWGLCEWIN